MKMQQLMLLSSSMQNVIDLLDKNKKAILFDPRTFSEAKSFQKKLLRKIDFIFQDNHADDKEQFAQSVDQFIELARLAQKQSLLVFSVPEISKTGFTNDFKMICEKHGINEKVIKYVFEL